MSFTDYLMAAPFWHWLMAFFIAFALSRWRPIKLVKKDEKHTHDHKHVHQEIPK